MFGTYLSRFGAARYALPAPGHPREIDVERTYRQTLFGEREDATASIYKQKSEAAIGF